VLTVKEKKKRLPLDSGVYESSFAAKQRLGGFLQNFLCFTASGFEKEDISVETLKIVPKSC